MTPHFTSSRKLIGQCVGGTCRARTNRREAPRCYGDGGLVLECCPAAWAPQGFLRLTVRSPQQLNFSLTNSAVHTPEKNPEELLTECCVQAYLQTCACMFVHTYIHTKTCIQRYGFYSYRATFALINKMLRREGGQLVWKNNTERVRLSFPWLFNSYELLDIFGSALLL